MFGTIENLRISGSLSCNGAVGVVDHQESRQSAVQTEVPDMTRIAFASLPILALEAGLCVFAVLGGAMTVLFAVLVASGILSW
jgi:hypothetical protein